MPVLKETKRSAKNALTLQTTSSKHGNLSSQRKEALGHLKVFQDKLSDVSTATNLSLAKKQIDLMIQNPALQVAVKVNKNIISIQDTQGALVDAFRAITQTSVAVSNAFKIYEEQFSAIAEVANNVGRTVKTLGVWQNQVIERGSFLGHQMQILGRGFKSIVENISLQSPDVSPDMFSTQVTYRETSFAIRLERDQIEEIADLAALKVLGKMEEKILLSPKPLSDQPSSAPGLEIMTSSLTSTAPTEESEVQWGGIFIDLNHATLQYKENPVIEIVPKNAEIKWLLCVLRKQGQVAEHTEIAVATGIITNQQSDKNNQAVARQVQFIRKRVVLVLKDAGMTPTEIKQMLLSKPGIGYAARYIENHTHAT